MLNEENNMLSRRESLEFLCGAALVGGCPSLVTKSAYAFLPFPMLLRFFLRSALRPSYLRNIRLAGQVIRGFSNPWSLSDGYYINKVPVSEIGHLGIDVGHIKEISKDLRDLCLETRPSAIWMEGAQNTFALKVSNNSAHDVHGEFILNVDSLFSDNQGVFEYSDVSISSNKNDSLVFQAPSSLSGRVVTLSGYMRDFENVDVQPSKRIVLARKNEIALG